MSTVWSEGTGKQLIKLVNKYIVSVLTFELAPVCYFFLVFCVFIGNGYIHLHEEVYRKYAEIQCHVIDRCCSCVCCSLSVR